ncbi:membrane dipeptidase [Mesorhizobium sp. M0184]|uniref:membrane dipeptidase n=1 Tax=Mesorhizobium sp. M0184 TaxID=2956906 RepID=UPI0033362EAD
MVQLAFNASNFVGSGCSDKADGGLTTFGAKVVQEIERQRIIVDLAHTGTARHSMASRPLIISHAGIWKSINTTGISVMTSSVR